MGRLMIAIAYQRNSQRFEVEATVMLEDFRTGFYYNGIIYNYSADGVYLESDYAPRPGRKIHLKVNGARDIFTTELYLAEIRWRQPLSDETSDYSYGIGMKYC
ncbi:hypothetical protein D1BOALGB6SA_8830 [Olavius sp. associated proteobacterium Delta 1]|nr:hypothetical protein D1BOALGB6SA_8830 [Olavius sp. associated proteobacterium Delta 1]